MSTKRDAYSSDSKLNVNHENIMSTKREGYSSEGKLNVSHKNMI